MKKAIAGALILTMVAAPLACIPAAAEEEALEPITLTVFRGDPGDQPADDNKIYQKIKDEFGVDFEFEFLAGDLDEKVKAIERIDEFILAPLMEALPEYGDFKIAVLPDHPTPIDVRTHTRDQIPIAVYSSNGEADSVEVYDEDSVKQGALGEIVGCNLMKLLLEE